MIQTYIDLPAFSDYISGLYGVNSQTPRAAPEIVRE